MPYAERTTVAVSKTRAEIEHTVVGRYGATRYGAMIDEEKALASIMFSYQGRFIRFVLPLPDPSAYEYATQLEQERRRVWRALFLVIKAKLESVASGIEMVEEAFMAQIVMPDNTTVADHVVPLIEASYRDGKMPAFGAMIGPGARPALPPTIEDGK